MNQLINLPEILPTAIPKRDGENGWRNATDGAGGNHYLLHPSKIRIREGFNVRKDYGDIEALAASIKENGQLQPGYVDAYEDGQFILTDGHRRFAAVQLLLTQGEDIKFKVVINSNKMTEEQRILQMFITQDNKHLEPIEASDLIRRLSQYGHDQISISKKIGRSPAYVSQMLSFSTESPVIQQAVTDGKLSVSTALKIKKAVPSQTVRNEAVKAAANTGKVTVENVTGVKRKSLAELVATNAILTETIRKAIKVFSREEKYSEHADMVEEMKTAIGA